MGRMSWDLATLQFYCWAGRAGWEADSDYAAGLAGPAGRPTRTTPSTGWADSDYAVDRIGRLGLRRHYGTDMPRRTSWTCRVAREATLLPGTSESTGVMSRLPEAVPRRSRSRNFTADVV